MNWTKGKEIVKIDLQLERNTYKVREQSYKLYNFKEKFLRTKQIYFNNSWYMVRDKWKLFRQNGKVRMASGKLWHGKWQNVGVTINNKKQGKWQIYCYHIYIYKVA